MPGDIRVRAVNADAVALGFVMSSREIDQTVERVVRHHGQLLRTRIRANASGRPGPNAPTGDYRRSWTLQVGRDPVAGITAYVGTNAPQGRRLEFGFYGADSLGRVYAQPPYPHVGPAFDTIAPQFERAILRVVEGI